MNHQRFDAYQVRHRGCAENGIAPALIIVPAGRGWSAQRTLR